MGRVGGGGPSVAGVLGVVLVLAVADGCQLSEWQQKILDKHNEWRAKTSPPAKDMHRVRWDTNIAANMQKWLDRCDSNWPHSDQDRDRKNVGGYDFLGENLAYCAGSACEALLSDGIPGYVGQSWWDEHKDYDWNSDSSRGGVTSHYTQMSSSNIYAIGCAAVKCPGPGPWGWNGEWWEFGCQYGPRGQGYWVGTKPFERGSGGLIEPPSSVFSKHPGLCSSGGPAPTPPSPVAPPPHPPAKDIDECQEMPCGKGQICEDTNRVRTGDFVCFCEGRTNGTRAAPAVCSRAECSGPCPAPGTPTEAPSSSPSAAVTPYWIIAACCAWLMLCVQ